jgi:nitrate reductase assembly molybdenum cofactor insertion protein NarJ
MRSRPNGSRNKCAETFHASRKISCLLSEDEEVLLRSQFATLKGKLKRIEEHLAEHNDQFRVVFEAIRQLLSEEEKPKKRIGF